MSLAGFAAEHPDADTLFKNSLPLSMPLDAAWASPKGKPAPLKLSLADGVFTLSADARKMLDWPDQVLLAWWWVNGKAVFPEVNGNQTVLQQDMSRLISETAKFTIAFSYPEYLQAKEGDTLALQVLYSPNGLAQVVNGERDLLMSGIVMLNDNLPQLSNRLEFKLSKELLAARNKTMDGK